MYRFITKGGNITKKLKGKSLYIENTSNQDGYMFFTKPYKTRKKSIRFFLKISDLVGKEPIVKLLTIRRHIFQEVNPNIEYFFDESPRVTFLTMKIPSKTSLVIDNIELDINEKRKEKLKDIFVNDYLMWAPMYPSYQNRYASAFLHSRIKAYEKNGIKVDLAVVNHKDSYHYTYEYEGVLVNNISYNDMREILQVKKYKKILIHFLSLEMSQILDATDLSETEVIINSHGADTLYRDRKIFARNYFSPEYEPDLEELKKYDKMDSIIKRYNNMSNFTFAFVAPFTKERGEELIGIKYNNYEFIPCVIDEDVFKYKKKPENQRKKICMIRSFHNLNSYSIDTNVKAILELSKRPIFKELEFSIYGKGDMHEILLAPLRNFSNVKIYESFLSSDEMAKMYSNHGISLFATKYDNQAVATLESAMCGTIPITSYGTGLSYYLSESIGNFTDATDYKAMADLIEDIVSNPKKFSKMSAEVHNSVVETASKKDTIEKEIKIIKKSPKKQKIVEQKPLDKKPLLTIAIPSYNCEKFLYNTVYSLIDHEYNNRVEIIIINDGSKDNTAKIAKELQKISPSVKLIDKENGGHGSTINVGIEKAKGKYFRLLDGDDYFITSNFVEYLKRLEKESADIVLTNYIEDFSIDAFMNPKRLYDNLEPYQIYNLDLLMYPGYGFKDFGPLLSTATYLTENLRKVNFKIDHHCFYVDMEYNFMGITASETLVYYPLDIYSYYLGRAGQSMSQESLKRNYLHHETVTIRLIKEYTDRKETMPEYKRKYIINRLIIPLATMQYDLALNLVKTREAFLSYDTKLKDYPEFYNMKEIISKKIKMHRSTNGATVKIQPVLEKTTEILRKFKN